MLSTGVDNEPPALPAVSCLPRHLFNHTGLTLEKIKDIKKALPGDFLHYHGRLYVIHQVRESGSKQLIEVQDGETFEISQQNVFSIFRTLIK